MYKRFGLFLFISILSACSELPNDTSSNHEDSHVYSEIPFTTSAEMQKFYENRISNQQVMLGAIIEKTLSDDTEDSRHQRFIIKLDSDQTILVAHNIDLAPRIPNIEPGEAIEIYGEYEWNDRGGILHWTHHDPQNQHVDGWVQYKGQRYQ